MLLFISMFTVESLSKPHVNGFCKSRKCSITPPQPSPNRRGWGWSRPKAAPKRNYRFAYAKLILFNAPFGEKREIC